MINNISNTPEIILSNQDEKLTRMLKALGNPVRFHIVKTLAAKKMCITGEIVEFTNLAQSTVSQHLKVLRDAEIIKGEIEGPATNYCLNQHGVRWLKEQIGNWLPGCCEEPIEVTPDFPSKNCC